jgi:acyl-CoA thioesterase I
MWMKYVLGTLCILGIAMLWLFLSGSVTSITNYPPKNSTIVAFGDSLVAGEGAPKGNDFVSVLSVRIGRPILNLGVNGDTTALGLARVSEITKRDPGIVILLLGGNDALQKVSLEATEANLRKLIDTIQKNGAVVVLVGIRGGILKDSYATLYESLAEEYGAVLVPDILGGIMLKPELMHDSVHPNEKGYREIAMRIQEVIEEAELLK